MIKKSKTAAVVAAAGILTIIGALLRGVMDSRRMRLIEEENKLLLAWIENRHDSGWAERVSDWAKQKAAMRVNGRGDGD
ncbi:MAG: hypothetical protein QME32_00875 [Endomicrobiia bacterium]|nr:hypothetical protein [Endomicrobiia bacterium]